IDRYLTDQMVSTLRCDEENQGKPHMEIAETFVNLHCQNSCSSNHYRDGFLAGLTPGISKHSPNLGRYTSYTKTSLTTRLPRYLTSRLLTTTLSFCSSSLELRDQKRVERSRKVKFPFGLHATELCTEVLRREFSPTSNGPRDLRKDGEDYNCTGGPLGNMKRAAANPADVAGGVVLANGFGAARSPLASPAEEENGEAVAKSKEAEANLSDRKQGFIDGLNPGIAQDQGCNLSGPVFPTILGALQGPGGL
ncbi:hypothetical protein HOY82DRAFT_476049, partial [Tuber indicum]